MTILSITFPEDNCPNFSEEGIAEVVDSKQFLDNRVMLLEGRALPPWLAEGTPVAWQNFTCPPLLLPEPSVASLSASLEVRRAFLPYFYYCF